MSIKSIIGNGLSGLGHLASGALTSISQRIEGLVGGATARLSALWDGGFVGLNDEGIVTLTQDIESYIGSLMDIADNFAANNDISGALKGETATAAQDYITAISKLLDAYCTTYRNFNQMAYAARQSMHTDDKGNAASIRDEAAQIENDAKSIQVDEVTDPGVN